MTYKKYQQVDSISATFWEVIINNTIGVYQQHDMC